MELLVAIILVGADSSMMRASSMGFPTLETTLPFTTDESQIQASQASLRSPLEQTLLQSEEKKHKHVQVTTPSGNMVT